MWAFVVSPCVCVLLYTYFARWCEIPTKCIKIIRIQWFNFDFVILSYFSIYSGSIDFLATFWRVFWNRMYPMTPEVMTYSPIYTQWPRKWWPTHPYILNTQRNPQALSAYWSEIQQKHSFYSESSRGSEGGRRPSERTETMIRGHAYWWVLISQSITRVDEKSRKIAKNNSYAMTHPPFLSFSRIFQSTRGPSIFWSRFGVFFEIECTQWPRDLLPYILNTERQSTCRARVLMRNP
jgi:hypothetical protein